MYQLLKPFLFLMTPEKAHHFTVALARIGFKIPLLNSLLKNSFTTKDASLKRSFMGLDFD